MRSRQPLRSLRIFSRHPSHKVLRKAKILLPCLTVFRLGSITKGNLPYECEINSVEAVQNSASKLRMKRCFDEAGVHHAEWYTFGKNVKLFLGGDTTKEKTLDDLTYPVVAKGIYGSRGRSNYKLDTKEALIEWMKGEELSQYVLEIFYKFSREYRLHITQEGCFYTCRKMLKTTTPHKDKWFRNESNCTWYIDTNPVFNKPDNWEKIVEDCKKALTAVGLDVGAFDVKMEASKNKDGKPIKNPEWILLECNSAPSMGEITPQRYIEQIPKIVEYKMKNK